MTIQLKVPEVGESITEAQIGQWLKSEGQHVERDEAIAQIESDKATVEVYAPASGTLSKMLKQKGETAKIGEIIGYLEEAAEAPPRREGRAAATVTETARREAEATRKAATPPPLPPPPRPAPAPMQRKEAAPPAELPAGAAEEIIPMTPIRRRIAERLVEAKSTMALLTTFNEFDMSAVNELRQKHRETFMNKHGVKLGLMSFFVKATVEALRAFPALNGEIRGDQIVYHRQYDLGIAVGGGKGLVVPVLRHAERMSFPQIEQAIQDFARRGEEGKLKLDELQGGTFTITNGGIYGSLLATPIVNPPQSGILGLHAIQDRPVARAGQVVIRPMMYAALTYDHRLVDGREAVLFLRHIRDSIEDPARILLDI